MTSDYTSSKAKIISFSIQQFLTVEEWFSIVRKHKKEYRSIISKNRYKFVIIKRLSDGQMFVSKTPIGWIGLVYPPEFTYVGGTSYRIDFVKDFPVDTKVIEEERKKEKQKMFEGAKDTGVELPILNESDFRSIEECSELRKSDPKIKSKFVFYKNNNTGLVFISEDFYTNPDYSFADLKFLQNNFSKVEIAILKSQQVNELIFKGGESKIETKKQKKKEQPVDIFSGETTKVSVKKDQTQSSKKIGQNIEVETNEDIVDLLVCKRLWISGLKSDICFAQNKENYVTIKNINLLSSEERMLCMAFKHSETFDVFKTKEAVDVISSKDDSMIKALCFVALYFISKNRLQ